jgi:hypothetical protein
MGNKPGASSWKFYHIYPDKYYLMISIIVCIYSYKNYILRNIDYNK